MAIETSNMDPAQQLATIRTYVNYNTELGRSNYELQSVNDAIRLAF